MQLPLPLDLLLAAAAVAFLVYVILTAAVFGILALSARRAGSRNLYRIGRVVFRVPPVSFRWRLWHSMVAILVLGTLFESVIVARRSSWAYRKARDHGIRSKVCRQILRVPGSGSFDDYCRARLRYHERMRQQYDELALHPWRSAIDEPPEPKITDYLSHKRTLSSVSNKVDN
jgi:hypothetical protein